MAYDYTDDIAFALEMITEYGRPVSFMQIVEAVIDPANPFADGSQPPVVVAGIPAVFVYPSGVQNLGKTGVDASLFKDCQQIALVAPNGVNDFGGFHLCTDSDGEIWKIATVQTLKPGAVNVLYYIGMVKP